MRTRRTVKAWQRPLTVALLLVLFGATTPARGQNFTRGNTNGDATVDLSDAICILAYLFNPSGSQCGLQSCLDAVDTNDDGTPDISDAVSLLAFLFQGGGPLPSPGTTSCGPDLTEDLLSCDVSNCEPTGPVCTLITVGGQGLQQDSDVAIDGAGNFFVVWEADSDEDDEFQIRGRAYNADGTAAIDRFQINSTSPFQQLDPTVAMDALGHVVVAWENDGNNNGLFNIDARGFNADGTETLPEFEVNSGTSGQQLDPDAAMDASGNFVVVWADTDGVGPDANFEVEGRGFNANGTELFAQFTINERESKLQANPAVAMDPSGNFVVVWQEKGTGFFDIMGRGFNADGTERVLEFTVNDETGGVQIDPVIAMNASGNFVVVWEHDGNLDENFEIEARGFNADGTELFAQFTVNTSQSGQQVDPTVAMNAVGNFVVAWEHDSDSDGEFHVRFRAFDADGTENLEQTRADCIEPAQHVDAAIAIDGTGRFTIFWEETPDFIGPSHLLGRTFPNTGPTGQ
jgi:hypothetical protein